MFNFISIEGNIGSGKTSLSKKISCDLKGKLILEKFSDNPFLPKFYENPDKNAFPLELFFMAERFQQLSKEKNTIDLFSKFTVSDYAFFKSKLFAHNNLKNHELNLFSRLYDIMFSSVIKPELLIYLHADIRRLQKNILKRGRNYEQNIADSYLKKIESRYLDYLKKQSEFPVLILDITHVNFVKEDRVYQRILTEINQFDKNKKIMRVVL